MQSTSRRGAIGAGLGLAAGSFLSSANAATVPPVIDRPMVARIWHGRTPASKADEYQAYLYESGVKRIAAIPGNRGVQMMVSRAAGQAEFMVVSFRDSREAIKGYAGEDYTRVHDLPRDREFLIEPETLVRHFDLPVNFWQT